MNSIGTHVYNNFAPLPPDYQGWNSNSPVFGKLIKETSPKTIIEVGTWKGMSAIEMANACDLLSLDTKIYCVDTWLGALEFWDELSHTSERNLFLKNGYPQVYYQFISNVIHKGHQNRIIPLPQTSLIGARYLKRKGITAELIYIDGSHDWEDVIMDMNSYWDILSPGGVMFGDDYSKCEGDCSGDVYVKKAVDLFVSQRNLTLQRFPNTWSDYWIIQK